MTPKSTKSPYGTPSASTLRIPARRKPRPTPTIASGGKTTSSGPNSDWRYRPRMSRFAISRARERDRRTSAHTVRTKSRGRARGESDAWTTVESPRTWPADSLIRGAPPPSCNSTRPADPPTRVGPALRAREFASSGFRSDGASHMSRIWPTLQRRTMSTCIALTPPSISSFERPMSSLAVSLRAFRPVLAET